MFRRKPAPVKIQNETDQASALAQIVDTAFARIEFSTDGQIIWANDNFLDAMEYSLDEVKGHHHGIFVDEAYRESEEYSEFWRRLGQGEFFTDRFRRISKTGKSIWIEATYCPVRSESGEIVRVIKIATDNTVRVKALEAMTEGMSHIEAGNLSFQVDSSQFPDDFESMAESFNRATSQLSETMEHVQGTSNKINQTSSELSSSASDLSSRTENQAATLEETTAAVERLSESVKSSAARAADVSDQAATARTTAKGSGQVVGDVTQAMHRIKSSSDEIAKIIGVIDDIAFQTNLLALNAGVEAARAGEAGKGFSVVASEVRALAQRSTESAKEIKTLISESSSHVDEGAILVERAGTDLAQTIDAVSGISDQIQKTTSELKDQSETLLEVASSLTGLDQITQQNAAMVASTSEMSRTMATSVATLQSELQKLSLADDDEAAFRMAL